jgi:iron complex transport system substrate-binding protein
MATTTINKNDYDAVIATPVVSIAVTSTTHIPALEALGVLDKLTGFPDTKYISSKKARGYIEQGKIQDIGSNETLNTELTIALQPDVLVGFGVDGQNSAYETLKRSNIPVVYNGDWTETTPLGKAEWIKFFAPFFQKEIEADTIFANIEASYNNVKKIAIAAKEKPTVMSGALYKDVWYLPGGNSWAAQFIKDANADYLWKDNTETGSLSLSWEHVLQKAKNADYWISPAQFISYEGMTKTSSHYKQFAPFKNKEVYTFSNTLGHTGGVLYYELAPQRPDLVLKDLVHILHPELIPEHEPYFFNPLQ